MAKRRKTRRTSRRRRVGAATLTASNPIVKFGSIAVGYLMADNINKPIQKMIDKAKIDVQPTTVGGVEAGVGYLLAFVMKKKTMLKQVVGGALIGAGIKKVLSESGVGGIGPYGRVPVVGGAVGPYGRVPVLGTKRMGAYSPNASLNGYSPNGSLNGKQKIVGSVSNATGSGLMQTAGSDCMN